MSPDFLALPQGTEVAEALSAIRHSTAPPEALNVVFTLDDDGAVAGSVSAVSLIRTDPSDTLERAATPDPVHVHPDWDLHAVVRQMSDYNLTVAPVMDEEHRKMLGVVTVDDVLETLLPSGWRKDAGMTAREE
jgi:Mg/Co/Ni transporter MgtE